MNQLPEAKSYTEYVDSIDNMIIWANSSSFVNHPCFQTPYLFLGNAKSAGRYRINDKNISISEHFFYLLNAGDELEIDLNKNEKSDTVIITFSNEVIQCISEYRKQSTEILLENYGTSSSTAASIPPIPFEYNREILMFLMSIQANDFAIRNDREEFFYEIADCLLIHAGKQFDMLNKLSVVRSSTRDELYRRIIIGKAFMHDTWADNITIDAIAKEACLNKYYFLKLFKMVYGITPHQYITGLKLRKSQELLVYRFYTITEICHLMGFESVGSFTNLFKKHFGQTPSEYRTSFRRN